jgi:hypothetical protein
VRNQEGTHQRLGGRAWLQRKGENPASKGGKGEMKMYSNINRAVPTKSRER